MIITWFHAGSSRSGASVLLALFTTNEEGHVIDACPMIKRAKINILDMGKLGFFVIKTQDITATLSTIKRELNCRIVRG